MKRGIATILSILFVNSIVFPQSNGLSFVSYEAALEKRTSLDISPDDSICLGKKFELEFDFKLVPNSKGYFGYVLRAISNGKSIDIIYDQKPKKFKVIIDDHFSDIQFSIDSVSLFRRWNHVDLSFDLDAHLLQFSLNEKITGTAVIPVGSKCYKFLWGANDYRRFATKDVPAMQVKEVRISEHKRLKYYWPLDQLTGDSCYDWVANKVALIKNPDWIKPGHQHWEMISNFSIRGDAGVAFNSKSDKIYVIGYDSIMSYSLTSPEDQEQWIPTNHLNLRLGNQAIYDTITDRLYDIFVDQQRVTSFDFSKKQWTDNFDSGRITEYWHFNKFISPIDSCIYVIGGYGQHKYKNLVQVYSPLTKIWRILSPGGDYFAPRFRAALGLNPDNSSVYVVGGYGSQSGDQMLGPQNFYDINQFDLRTDSFHSLFTLNPVNKHFTFGNSLVVDPLSEYFYGLIYANDSSNSKLQLIRGSFKDSGFIEMANPIHFRLGDIESFCDLYYSPLSEKLIAIILRNAKVGIRNRITEVEIYSLDFPPAGIDPAKALKVAGSKKATYWFIGLFVTAIVALIFIIKVKKKMRRLKGTAVAEDMVLVGTESVIESPARSGVGSRPKSTISLFGQFQVSDKEGADITNQFSPLLKELFLLIAGTTLQRGRGISSAELDDILWHDKPYKDAKNNRAVNIAKLKGLLEKVGYCTLSKHSGDWQLVCEEGLNLDLKNFREIIDSSMPLEKNIRPLIEIVKRGAFLYQTEYSWLDDIKAGISNTVIDLCHTYLVKQPSSTEPEFKIEICNVIFQFDPLHEDALVYKCKCLILLKRHTLANNIYLKFVKDYKEIYGIEYPRSFQEIIE